MPCMGHVRWNRGRAECLSVYTLVPRAQSGGTVCVVSAVGFVCLREWVCVGESAAWPLTPRLSRSLRSWEIQGLLASPPHAPHKVTFRGTLFPPNPKHTTLFFPGRRPGKVGVHMRGLLLSAHGAGDPTCETQPGSSSQAHCQGTHWLLSHQPTRCPCMCGLHNSHMHISLRLQQIIKIICHLFLWWINGYLI